jgi:hypothetical protein
LAMVRTGSATAVSPVLADVESASRIRKECLPIRVLASACRQARQSRRQARSAGRRRARTASGRWTAVGWCPLPLAGARVSASGRPPRSESGRVPAAANRSSRALGKALPARALESSPRTCRRGDGSGAARRTPPASGTRSAPPCRRAGPLPRAYPPARIKRPHPRTGSRRRSREAFRHPVAQRLPDHTEMRPVGRG